MNNKILACLDHSTYATGVCDYAAWSALRLDAALEFIHVLDHHPEVAQKIDLSGSIGLGARENLLNDLTVLDEKRATISLERGRLLLEAAKRRAVDDGVQQPMGRQRHGEVVATLTELESETRLFVLGKRGEAGDRAPEHMGANLERAVRALHRPILVVPPHFAAPARAMVAFDGSMTTRKGVELIAASPLFKGLEIHVVLVGPDNQTSRSQVDWASDVLARSGVKAISCVVEGHADHVLPAYAAKNAVDLLVMGAYGHSRVRQLLVGSTTTAVIRTSSIPVLLVR